MTLSPRQFQIVLMVGRDGLSWAQVYKELGITESTVQVHVNRIRIKYGLTQKPREAMVHVYYQVMRFGDGRHVDTESTDLREPA